MRVTEMRFCVKAETDQLLAKLRCMICLLPTKADQIHSPTQILVESTNFLLDTLRETPTHNLSLEEASNLDHQKWKCYISKHLKVNNFSKKLAVYTLSDITNANILISPSNLIDAPIKSTFCYKRFLALFANCQLKLITEKVHG